SARSRQAEPPGEVHRAGELPAAPTATNPDRAAVTASSCPLVPGAVSEARAQVFRSAENHAAGGGLPPGRVLTVTTYPAGPAAAAVRLVPGAVSVPLPGAGAHDAPRADVRITGWYGARVPAWPTVSQPEPPRSTLTSAPLRHDVGSSTSAGDHRPPGEASHRAGAPPAAPAAAWVRSAVARGVTRRVGAAAAGGGGAGELPWLPGGAAAARPARPPGRPPPPPVTSRYGRVRADPGWFPATTTLPPGPAVSPATPLPGSAICCHRRPCALKNATRPEWVAPATAQPPLFPATVVTRLQGRRSGASLPTSRHREPRADL